MYIYWQSGIQRKYLFFEKVYIQMKRNEIHVRDPFILPVPEEKCYYLFGTTDFYEKGFNCWKTSDLENFSEAFPAYRPAEDMADSECFWAPEVHRRGGNFFMFATFKKPGKNRECRVLVSDQPQGPYTMWSPAPLTPPEWMCLDGTLYTDPCGKNYMIFCHEWMQIHNGSIELAELSCDLQRIISPPRTLFHGSDAPWSAAYGEAHLQNYVTDGPFVFEEDGKLYMLWSSFSPEGSYAMGAAESVSGKITGPWIQLPEPIVSNDGGHGMIFHTFEGKRMLTYHAPNTSGNERPFFIPFPPCAG